MGMSEILALQEYNYLKAIYKPSTICLFTR